MAKGELGEIVNQASMEVREGQWTFDDDDWALYAMLCDPIYMAELLFTDHKNREWHGTYHVRDYQYPLFRTTSNYQAFPTARDVGKALANGEPVLTPSGYKPIEELEPFDVVYGSDGQPTFVLGVFPQGERDLYRVTFKDGTHVDCDDDHLWTVTCDQWESDLRRGRRTGGPRTLRTSELRHSNVRYRVQLPAGPVEFLPREPYDIDPWLVGALIGDGNLTRPTMVRFASVDEPIVERFRSALPDDAELVHDEGCNYRVRSVVERQLVGGCRFEGCRNGPSALGLCSGHYQQQHAGRELTALAPHRGTTKLLKWARDAGMQKSAWEKRVPEELLAGSVRERLEVLRGMSDTDGSVTKYGLVEISTASPGLARDIKFIVGSLGGRASINTGSTSCRDRHRVVFCLPGLNPFHLPRKADSYDERNATRQSSRHVRIIALIEPIGRGHATCISVAAEDGLFMTRDMVLTHNTESQKAKAVCHAFKRIGEDMLLTAPETIHLEGLTKPIENRINDIRLTRDFLRKDNQKSGFTHKPFECVFADGTRLIGRIPHLDGSGVKGPHVPDMLMDEAQDYPEDGWTEVIPTVIKDHTDSEGNYDFTLHFYGVHSGGVTSGTFATLSESASYEVTPITMLQKPGWNKQEKAAFKAMYGGTTTPDYRRNVLGERGNRVSQFFSTARLLACTDQDKESVYNTRIFKAQEFEAESLDELIGPGGDVGELLDLPDDLGQQVYGGMDVGLVSDPTVITIWATMADEKKRSRLTLVRMIHLNRFTEKQIRQMTYRIGRQYGLTLRSFGQDITGLGLPLYQAMEADEQCPKHLRDVSRGYVFNGKVPVGVDKNYVSEQGTQLVDQYGHLVEVVRDKWTGQEQLVARMTMIEASTRYLRGFVDPGFLRLPSHEGLIKDFQGESEQRVRAMGGVRKKPNAFHILDSARAFAMAYKAGEMEEQVYARGQVPVMDRALDLHVPEFA